MSFIAELKRRNVFKVGVAYAIVAWLLIQVASVIVPAYQAPGWVMPIFVTLVSLGFPIALFLAWVYELTPEGIKVTTSEGPAQFHTRTTGQRLNYFIVGVLVLVVAFIVVDNHVLKDTGTSTIPTTTVMPDIKEHSTTPQSTNTTPVAAAGPVRRTYLPLGLTQTLRPTQLNAMVTLSPDGLQLVYLVNRSEGVQLQHRNLNQLSSQTLALPAGGILDVFFSPDGEWVGVTTDDAIYKVSLQGGSPQLLAGGLYTPFGGHWTADGTIYFSAGESNTLQLCRVRDTGGTPEPITVTGGKAGDGYSYPYVLPGGTHVLATQAPLQQARDGRIVLVDLNTGKSHVLIQNGYRARYVPTGHIVFMRSGSLWAVPFDVKQLAITGPEVPVVQEVEHGSAWGPAVYAFSDEGLLVYLAGGDMQTGGSGVSRQLVWVDRDGTETPLPAKAQDYGFPRLSPDGTQVAVMINNAVSRDIWTYDISRNILSRRTFSGDAVVPLWAPDGTRLVYTFFYPDFQGLAWVRADGTGQPEQLVDAPRLLFPSAFTPDGSTLIYSDSTSGPPDLYTLSLTGEHTEQPLLATKFSEGSAALSPDGHWLAYNSNETGQNEIYVRPYPNVDGGKWQVSTEGGGEPHWRGDGKELFYRKPGDPVTVVAVPVESEPRFQSGTPVELFHGDYFVPPNGISYDVTADGQRFLFTKAVAASGEEEEVGSRETNLVVVDNWFAELKRLAPPAQ